MTSLRFALAALFVSTLALAGCDAVTDDGGEDPDPNVSSGETRIASVLRQDRGSSDESWQNLREWDYAYDASGYLVGIAGRGEDGTLSSQETFTRNADGLWTEHHRRYNMGTEDEEVSRSWARYEGTRIVETRAGDGTATWETAAGQDLYAYDARDLWSEVTRSVRTDSSGWRVVALYTYAYNADSTLQTLTSDLYDEEGQPSSKFRSHYTYTNGRAISGFQNQLFEDTSERIATFSYRYDEDGNLAEFEVQRFEQGAFYHASRNRYTWEQVPEASQRAQPAHAVSARALVSAKLPNDFAAPPLLSGRMSLGQ